MTDVRPPAPTGAGGYRKRASDGTLDPANAVSANSGAVRSTSAPAGGSPKKRGPQKLRRRGSSARRQLVFVGAGVALAGLLAVVLFVAGPRRKATPSAAGAVTVSQTNPPGINSATSNLMSLSYVSGASPAAADFHLTDQRGQAVSLAQFRGKAVVLSFNDDRCVDMCPLFAQDVVRADRYLGAAARHVVFLAVNVNPFYPQVSNVKAWTDNHALAKVSNWYFATGTVPALQKVWKAYGEVVQANHAKRTVSHDSLLEFIAPNGHVSAAGQFGEGAADVSPFSHGIAQMAVDLLPSAERASVGGHDATSSVATGGGIGQESPSFDLPSLGSAKSVLGSAAMRGHPVVLNFWASSCPDCRAELASFAKLAKREPNLRFVGIDVADPSVSSARTLVHQAGTPYPVLSDSSGAVARAFRISELPTTIYLGPGGHVIVRHPGILTYDELAYTLALAFPGQAAHIGGD